MGERTIENLISVVTVVFNAADTLEKTIQSVIGQRDVNVQFIVIDGGSSDGTMAIVKRYSDRIATWVSERDKGIYDAMNKGIRLAHGGWVLFLNAGDTFIDDDSLKRLLQAAIAAPKLPGMVFGDVSLVRQGRPAVTMKMYNSLPFLIRHSICHQAMLYHRSTFREIGDFDASYRFAADFEHLMRMKWSDVNILKLESVVARYPLDGVSAKGDNISKIWKERMRIYSSVKSIPFLVRVIFWLYAKMAYEFRKRTK